MSDAIKTVPAPLWPAAAAEFQAALIAAEANARAMTEALEALAAEFVKAADRAALLVAEDERRRDAAQIRLIAQMTRPHNLDMGAAWLTAGRKLLSCYDEADMAEVHASRSSRHTVRQEKLAAEAQGRVHTEHHAQDCEELLVEGLLIGACVR